MKFKKIFLHQKPLIGVVRLLPLKGHSKYPGNKKIIEVATNDIQKLEKAGFDGALIDDHVHPHTIKIAPEAINSFIQVMKILVKNTKIPLGVQVLLNDPEASLLIAQQSGAQFIRTDFFVDLMKTEHGIMNINPKKLMKYKKKIKANNVALFSDIQVKHATMLTKKTLKKSINEAIAWGADGIIITGNWTGVAPSIKKITKAKLIAQKHSIPVIIGSGFCQNNADSLLTLADGFLIGTAIRNGSRIHLKKSSNLVKNVTAIKKEKKMISNELEGPKLVDLEKIAQVEQMKDFFKQKGVTNPKFLISGHMNLTWHGIYQGKNIICQFGPNLANYQIPISKIKNYGYFDPNKFERAQNICASAQKNGIPCPSIISAGFANNLSRAWCIEDFAQGVSLDTVWVQLPSSSKISIGQQIGQALANVHSIDPLVSQQKIDNPQNYLNKWINNVIANLITLNIYQPKELSIIKKNIIPFFTNNCLPPFLTITHGDILQKNIFIDNSQKYPQVSSIIDWETAGIGSPWANIILAAWWLSGEYDGNKKIFESIINSYNENQTISSLVIPLDKAKYMTPYIDILWYLNILWVRPLMGDYSQIERRKKMVSKILKEIT